MKSDDTIRESVKGSNKAVYIGSSAGATVAGKDIILKKVLSLGVKEEASKGVKEKHLGNWRSGF